MPPPLSLWSAFRTLSIRSRPLAQCHVSIATTRIRHFADDVFHNSAHTTPDNGQALPPSMLDSSQAPTLAHRNGKDVEAEARKEAVAAFDQLQMAAYGLNPYDLETEGHKYGLPEKPLPPGMHLKKRYDPIIQQLTRLLMRHGKLSKAQRDMAMILNYLRTSPEPKYNPERRLLPGHPPPSHLPLNPVEYLVLAIDSVAPLIRIRTYKGVAGGGRSLEVPMPLEARQRRRQAFMWILDVVNKKKSKLSGRARFPNRVAEEVVAVVEGKSSVWTLRQQVHRLGTSVRANVRANTRRKAKKGK